MEPREDESDPRSRLGLLLPVLVVAWLIAVPVLALHALAESFVLGRSATTAELVGTDRGLQVTAGVALLVAATGLVLSVKLRSRLGLVLFCLLLMLSFGAAGTSAYYTHLLHRNDPVPDPYPRQSAPCQEYSGGDTRCPGG